MGPSDRFAALGEPAGSLASLFSRVELTTNQTPCDCSTWCSSPFYGHHARAAYLADVLYHGWSPEINPP